MNLSIENLQEMGAFTGAPVQKEVTWKQGDRELKATVYVRKMSYHTARSDVMAARGAHDGLAGRIAACICDADGNSVFTAEDVTGEADPERGALNDNLVMALLNVIAEVNGLGKAKPPRQGTSTTKRKSGTSS